MTKLFKSGLTCPFCLNDLGVFKIFIVKRWIKDKSNKLMIPIAKDEKAEQEFDTKSLQNHILSCSQVPSEQILKLYKLHL